MLLDIFFFMGFTNDKKHLYLYDYCVHNDLFTPDKAKDYFRFYLQKMVNNFNERQKIKFIDTYDPKVESIKDKEYHFIIYDVIYDISYIMSYHVI